MTSKSRGYKFVILFVQFFLQDTALVHHVRILTQTDQNPRRYNLQSTQSLYTGAFEVLGVDDIPSI